MNFVRVLVVVIIVFIAGLFVLFAFTGVDVVRQENTMWNGTIGRLQENTADKKRQAETYSLYAGRAAREQQGGAERLFRAMSASENIHAKNMQRAIERLGSLLSYPGYEADSVFATQENLLRSLAREDTMALRVYPAAIDTAVSEDARYAARILLWAAGTDMKHSQMIRYCLEHLGVQCDSTCYWVCPTCGNTFSRRNLESYCPFCMTHSVRFLSF